MANQTSSHHVMRSSVRVGATLALALAMLVFTMLAAGAKRTGVAAQAAADATSVPGAVCFYQRGHPTCVERPDGSAVSLAASDIISPRNLLAALLAGPTRQERALGIESAIPPETRLVSVLSNPSNRRAITVRLALPAGYLDPALHRPALNPVTVEAIVDQVVNTLFPLGYRDFYVQAQDPWAPDTFRPLSAYLPDFDVPAKSGEVSSRSSELRAEGGDVTVVGRPQGGLSGKTVYVSAGHGWQWNGSAWRTQRPPYPDASTGYEGPIVEDHNNAEVVNQYLLQYLWNAGAEVWTARERDMHTFGQIIDDEAVSATAGVWEAVAGEGYGSGHLQAATAATSTAVITWETNLLPADGVYALYVWYVSGSDRPADARYTVYHAGGATELTVDQRHHGHTWRYVGGFPVRAGDRLTVTLSNRSATPGRFVSADAVRLGGGTFDSLAGIDTSAPYPPDKPWWEIAAYYHVQRLGLDPDDYMGDVIVRPCWARWEHASTGDDAIYVSWHTNGYNGHNTTAWGTVSFIHSTQAVEGSAALRHAIHSELINDARAGWDPAWRDLGEASKDLGELRELWDTDPADAIPGALIEIAYHDHVTDTNALKDPRFAQLSARAVYQGIVKYFEGQDGVDLVTLPEPPTHLAVRNDGPGRVTVSWRPSPTDGVGLVGEAADSYRVYTSPDGLGWGPGRPVSETTCSLTDLAPNTLLFVHVTAVNAGGESLPTPVLAARTSPDGVAPVLVVDGFDRIDRYGLPLENDPVMGLNARLWPDRVNSFDYVVEHGQAISLPFDSVLNEAVAEGDLTLAPYSIVDWILGEESSHDRTLDAAERQALEAYLEGGNGLFISGAELGWDLMALETDPDFYRTYLGVDWAGDDAGTYWASPVGGGLFDGLGTLVFQENYDVDFADQLIPRTGSRAALNYVGGDAGVGAIQHDAGGCRRVVYLGFPFETLDAAVRPAVMGRILDYLGAGCLPLAPYVTIESPPDGGAFNVVPRFAGTAAGLNPIERVEVQVSAPDGRYWDGQNWGEAPLWLRGVGTATWSYSLPISILTGSVRIAALDQGAYALAARAYDVAARSDDQPATAHFVYDTISPATPILVTPADGMTFTRAPTYFFWQGALNDGGSDIGYRLQIDDRVLTRAVTHYVPLDALAPGTHTWRVQGFDAAGNSSLWTPRRIFAIERSEIYLPLLLKGRGEPDDGDKDLVINGGFETDEGWDLSSTGHPASYVTSPVYSGNRAAQAWVPAGETGYSSLAQQLVLPDQAPLVLSLWFYPVYPDDDTGDLQYISLKDGEGSSHLLWMARQNDEAWLELELDLSIYRGQEIELRFGVKNDGDAAPATLVVDEISLLISGH